MWEAWWLVGSWFVRTQPANLEPSNLEPSCDYFRAATIRAITATINARPAIPTA
jgi:hypothetical protein